MCFFYSKFSTNWKIEIFSDLPGKCKWYTRTEKVVNYWRMCLFLACRKFRKSLFTNFSPREDSIPRSSVKKNTVEKVSEGNSVFAGKLKNSVLRFTTSCNVSHTILSVKSYL